MLLRQMKYFSAVVDYNSFTGAAAQCYISQSAISQQIQALEQEVGVELIRRGNRRFTLTPAGQHFYPHCKAILEQTDELVRETKRLGSGDRAQLCIGYLRCYSGMGLYQAVADFSKLHPEVDIRTVNGTHEVLYDLLRSGGLDLVLSDQRRAFSQLYVNFELMQCGCYAELSAHNPLSRQPYVRLEQLKRIPCILIASREQRNAEQEYYQHTLGFGSSYLFAEHLEEGRLLVVSNQGFLPIDRVGTLPPEGASIRRLPVYLGERQIVRNYCAFWHKDQDTRHVQAFADLLRRLLTQGTPDQTDSGPL